MMRTVRDACGVTMLHGAVLGVHFHFSCNGATT